MKPALSYLARLLKSAMLIAATIIMYSLPVYSQYDECSGAVTLPISQSIADRTSVNFTTATRSSQPLSSSCDRTTYVDIWVKFTATTPQMLLRIGKVHSEMTKFHFITSELYKGSTCANLLFQSCSEEFIGEVALTFRYDGLTVGEQYYVKLSTNKQPLSDYRASLFETIPTNRKSPVNTGGDIGLPATWTSNTPVLHSDTIIFNKGGRYSQATIDDLHEKRGKIIVNQFTGTPLTWWAPIRLSTELTLVNPSDSLPNLATTSSVSVAGKICKVNNIQFAGPGLKQIHLTSPTRLADTVIRQLSINNHACSLKFDYPVTVNHPTGITLGWVLDSGIIDCQRGVTVGNGARITFRQGKLITSSLNVLPNSMITLVFNDILENYHLQPEFLRYGFTSIQQSMASNFQNGIIIPGKSTLRSISSANIYMVNRDTLFTNSLLRYGGGTDAMIDAGVVRVASFTSGTSFTLGYTSSTGQRIKRSVMLGIPNRLSGQEFLETEHIRQRPPQTSQLTGLLRGLLGSSMLRLNIKNAVPNLKFRMDFWAFPTDSLWVNNVSTDIVMAQAPTPNGPWVQVSNPQISNIVGTTFSRFSRDSISLANGTYFAWATVGTSQDVFPSGLQAVADWQAGCPGSSATRPVRVRVENRGAAPLTRVTAGYLLDGVEKSKTVDLNPALATGFTRWITMDGPLGVDLTTDGLRAFRPIARIPNEPNTTFTNDTGGVYRYLYQANPLPYRENFDTARLGTLNNPMERRLGGWQLAADTSITVRQHYTAPYTDAANFRNAFLFMFGFNRQSQETYSPRFGPTTQAGWLYIKYRLGCSRFRDPQDELVIRLGNGCLPPTQVVRRFDTSYVDSDDINYRMDWTKTQVHVDSIQVQAGETYYLSFTTTSLHPTTFHYWGLDDLEISEQRLTSLPVASRQQLRVVPNPVGRGNILRIPEWEQWSTLAGGVVYFTGTDGKVHSLTHKDGLVEVNLPAGLYQVRAGAMRGRVVVQ